MKTLRYLLMSLAIVSVLSISAQEPAQDWGKEPESRMHSTSAMAGSGSTLPFAAVDGVTTTCVSPAKAPAGPRRIGGGNSGGGDGPTTPEDVWSTPLGDALWSLALLALVFVFGKWTAKKLNHSANIN
ncbi:MAG: hypothetical protein IJ548_00415 [Paludibacteraceae bacterium]|nr:hypothetical protein [Paludibacteraceae bacterium]